MKKNARILSLLLSVAMVFGLMAVPAAAKEGSAIVTVAAATEDVKAGETVVLTVTVTDNPGVAGASGKVVYDEATFEFVGLIAADNGMNLYNINGSAFTLEGTVNVTGDFEMFSIELKALADVAAADVDVTIEGKLSNEDGEIVAADYIGSKVTTGGSTTGGSTTGGNTTGGNTTGGNTTGGNTTGSNTTGGNTTGGNTTGGNTTGGNTTGGNTTGGNTTGDGDTGSDDDGDTTVETVISTESEAAVTEGEVNETLKEAAGENAAYYDVTVNVTVCTKGLAADAEHTDCDETRPATDEELAAYIEENGGIPVVLDIPEGTSPDTHTYIAYAIVNNEVVELEVTVTEDGKLSVLVPGAGTIALAWTEIVVEEELSDAIIIPRLLPVTVKVEEGAKVNTTAKFLIAYGARRTINITVEEGYEVADIIVNGKSVGAADSYTLKGVAKAQTIVIKTAEVVEEVVEEAITEEIAE